MLPKASFFVVARSGGDDDSSSSSDTTTQSSQPASGGGGSDDNGTGGTTTPAKPAVQTVVVKDAKPVGGVKRLKFKHNDQIVFVVKSDTADEVHFHGYDVHKDVEAGGSVHFKFPAKIDGKFIVELEDHGVTLANVTVEP